MAKNSQGGGAATSLTVFTGNATASNHHQVSSVYVSEEVMIDIMSRLPVPSLMRFKCLSRRWFYLIRQDKHFISSHFSRSKLNRKFLITLHAYNGTRRSIITLDLLTLNIEQIPIPTKASSSRPPMRGLVNGLLCFMDPNEIRVCIYNPSTREETPWMRPNIAEGSDCKFGFGFDPVTQKHKVVYLIRDPLTYNIDSDYEVFKCEVLTVGENYWKRKEDVALPQSVLSRNLFYSNGSLYWCVPRPSYRGPGGRKLIECIVVFDVGKEKFRTIEYPEDSNGVVGEDHYIDVLLQGVDGRLVLMDKWYYDDENKVTKMRIWTIDDDDKENNTSNWISEETIDLPITGKEVWFWLFESINDLLVIIVEDIGEVDETLRKLNREVKKNRVIHIYDMKKKKVIEFSRLLSLSQFNEVFLDPYRHQLSVFSTSIYPVCATATTTQD